MEVRFVKTDPTGNTTVLVESPVDGAEEQEVARRLMSGEYLCAEQVGFILPAQCARAAARLRMMGGEFCGNAAMSLAAFLVWRDGEATLGGINVPIEVSGADGVVDCLIRRQEGGYRGTVRMPPPDGIEELTLPLAGAYRKFTSVRLPGITHVVVPLEIFGAKRADDRAVRDETERTAREWARLIEDAAFGLLLYDDANTSITPLVLVRSIGTMVWERGCGSGSAAIGAYIAKKSGCDAVSSVIQPGGVIEVDARLENGVVSDVSITGNVRITARGTAYV